MQVGTTKDQGLYNQPSAAMHPGALAAGTLIHTYMYDFQPNRPIDVENTARIHVLRIQIKCGFYNADIHGYQNR